MYLKRRFFPNSTKTSFFFQPKTAFFQCISLFLSFFSLCNWSVRSTAVALGLWNKQRTKRIFGHFLWHLITKLNIILILVKIRILAYICYYFDVKHENIDHFIFILLFYYFFSKIICDSIRDCIFAFRNLYFRGTRICCLLLFCM